MQLCTEELGLPDDLPAISTVCRPQFLTPLAFMPLSEEEQVCVRGRVCVCVCVRACVRVCVRACVGVGVGVGVACI